VDIVVCSVGGVKYGVVMTGMDLSLNILAAAFMDNGKHGFGARNDIRGS
jgi:hypothetical protein